MIKLLRSPIHKKLDKRPILIIVNYSAFSFNNMVWELPCVVGT